MSECKKLIEKLAIEHSLSLGEYKNLIEGYNEENAAFLAELAVEERKKYYSNNKSSFFKKQAQKLEKLKLI